MSADYILSTLNGVMSSQAEGLSEEEKVGISEYITGGKVSASLPDPNFCNSSNKLIKLSQKNSYMEKRSFCLEKIIYSQIPLQRVY